MISKDILRKLKLIVFDLDGTLLREDGSIGPDSIALIKQLRETGVYFSIATGRLHSATTQFIGELGIDLPIISLDGSLIKGGIDDTTIYESNVPVKYVKKAIHYADQYLLKIALCHAEAIYYTENNSVIPELLEKFGATYDLVSSYDNILENTLEIVIAGDYRDSIKHVENRMIFPYSFGLQASSYKSHRHGGIYYLEIRKHGSSKGKGLQRLSKHLKISVTETAVMGDWYNDKSLFESGGLKIAVQNAVPELKNMADFVTKRTNNEDAVAEFLEMVLKSKQSDNADKRNKK